MDLTSKQRAQLRGLANDIDTIVHIGKDGIGDNLIKQADDALEARELIKGKVLENSMLSRPGGGGGAGKGHPQPGGSRSLEQSSCSTRDPQQGEGQADQTGEVTWTTDGRPAAGADGAEVWFCQAKPYAQAEFVSAEQDETRAPWELAPWGNGSLEQSSYSIARPMARKKISGSSW